ncbi:hypothetical protein [Planctomicrobium sp. SH527]|uniref:hypothetical protein n=1 Tax=Planctomicrobium sp. SH527 TaxID=3448123 RepID=UPI003F5BEDA4
MIQSVEKPETEEFESSVLSLDQLQTILHGHFDRRFTLEDQTSSDGKTDILVKLDLFCRMNYYSGPVDSQLANSLRAIASKCLAAAAEIETEVGIEDEPELYICDGGRRVAVVGMEDDFSIDVLNSSSDNDALRQARKAIAYMTNGKPIQKPANYGPVKLLTLEPPEYRFQCDTDRFQNCEIVVRNQSNKRDAKQEATAFIDWLQAQASPETSDQHELRIA